MSTYLTDEQLRAITPEIAELYLRARGWTCRGRPCRSLAGKTFDVWGKYQDLIEVHSGLSGIHMMIDALSDVERRCPCRIYEDMVGPPAQPDVPAFLADLAALCRRHGLSLSHEDEHGGFLVERWDEELAEWLAAAGEGESLQPPKPPSCEECRGSGFFNEHSELPCLKCDGTGKPGP